MTFLRTAAGRCPAVILCIAAIAGLLAGCQGLNEPQPVDQDSALQSEGMHATMSLAAATPRVTLTNEYMDPARSGSSTPLSIPEGVPLTFCWTASPGADGAAISAYRYGWDILDPADPDAWDMDFIPWDGSEVCAPTRAFETGLHLFAVQVIDDAGVVATVRVVILLTLGPSSFDVMPGTCQNKFNSRRHGRIRTAIAGRPGMDIEEIDVSSLSLWIDGNVVDPIDVRVRDVTGAVIPATSCGCPAAGPDGHDDLVMFFDAADISRALGPVSNGEERRLTAYGALVDGYQFQLTDCITIAGNPPGDDDLALFDRDAVIATLQRAYNAADYGMMALLLDEGFTFVFSPGDVATGDAPSETWDREAELAATAAMFDIVSPYTESRIVKPTRAAADEETGTWGRLKAGFADGTFSKPWRLEAYLGFSEGEGNWVAVPASDPRFPGETWYAKSAGYFVSAGYDGGSYVGYLYRALFTVRLDDTGRWRLVEWRDDIQ